jgi:predicted RNA-binding Zn ribbon-like protein
LTRRRYHLRSVRRYQELALREAATSQIARRTTANARPVAAVRLDGGRLCLEFVNTIHDRYAPEAEDYVGEPERFIEWSLRAGALRQDEGVAAPDDEARRAALMGEVRTLRAHLHGVLAARVDGVPPADEAVRCLDEWVHRAWAGQALGPDGRMHWREETRDELLPLKRIALDALDLISSHSISRLRRCHNTNSCGWLFLDVSRNGRRRWCAMETCGTLVKMRRYRGRAAG